MYTQFLQINVSCSIQQCSHTHHVIDSAVNSSHPWTVQSQSLTVSHLANHTHIATTLGTPAPNEIIKSLLNSLFCIPSSTPPRTNTHTHMFSFCRTHCQLSQCRANDSVPLCSLSYNPWSGKVWRLPVNVVRTYHGCELSAPGNITCLQSGLFSHMAGLTPCLLPTTQYVHYITFSHFSDCLYSWCFYSHGSGDATVGLSTVWSRLKYFNYYNGFSWKSVTFIPPEDSTDFDPLTLPLTPPFVVLNKISQQ